MKFLKLEEYDHIINVNQIVEIDYSVTDRWTVTMVNGSEYDIEGDELITLQAMVGV